MAVKRQEQYGNSSISMLKGEDRVRKRPAVIFGSDDLEGCIITTGSDAHNTGRVGEHIAAATELARDIFGHVCTFEDRKVIFHKL